MPLLLLWSLLSFGLPGSPIIIVPIIIVNFPSLGLSIWQSLLLQPTRAPPLRLLCLCHKPLLFFLSPPPHLFPSRRLLLGSSPGLSPPFWSSPILDIVPSSLSLLPIFGAPTPHKPLGICGSQSHADGASSPYPQSWRANCLRLSLIFKAGGCLNSAVYSVSQVPSAGELILHL